MSKMIFKNEAEELAYYRKQKSTYADKYLRARVKTSLLLAKAIAKGLTVSESEIDAEIAKRK